MQKNTADTLLMSTAFLRKILSCFIVSVSLPDFIFQFDFYTLQQFLYSAPFCHPFYGILIMTFNSCMSDIHRIGEN